MNGVLRRWITAAQCSVGEFRRLGINVEVHWFHSDAKRTWIRSLGWVSTERGGAGPSAAESVPCACRATATVQRGCASMHEATRSYQEDWAVPNGVEPPFCSLSAATVIRPPQDTPAQAGQGATDARKAPSARVELRTSRPGGEQRAKGTVAA